MENTFFQWEYCSRIGFSSFLEEKLKWGQIPSQGFGKSREFQRNPLKSWVCLEVEEHSYVPFSWEFSWENPGSDAAMTKKKRGKIRIRIHRITPNDTAGKSQSIPFSHTGKADFFRDHSYFSWQFLSLFSMVFFSFGAAVPEALRGAGAQRRDHGAERVHREDVSVPAAWSRNSRRFPEPAPGKLHPEGLFPA